MIAHLSHQPFAIGLLVCTLVLTGVSQVPPRQVDEIVSKASAQRKTYIDEFKNLIAEETKTFELYGKNGEVKKRRAIVSTFIVYQLTKDENRMAEYRSIISVDGKKLEHNEKRAEDFFEQVAKADSSQKELLKIEGEGSRYDEDISLSLFTLYQAVPLAENIQPSLEFRLERDIYIARKRIHVVSFVQTKSSPYILADNQRELGDGKPALKYETGLDDKPDNVRLRGEFWIDADTFQVWREQRTLTVQPEGWQTPVVIAETIFEYQRSDFGILTPKRIEHTQFDLRKKEKVSVKDTRIIFEYSKFTKPDVEVKSSDVKSN